MNNEKDNQYRSHNAISEVCLSTSMSLSTYPKASAFTCGMPCVEILSPSKRWGYVLGLKYLMWGSGR